MFIKAFVKSQNARIISLDMLYTRTHTHTHTHTNKNYYLRIIKSVYYNQTKNMQFDENLLSLEVSFNYFTTP